MSKMQEPLTLLQLAATTRNGRHLIVLAELADACGHHEEALELIRNAYLLFDLSEAKAG
jgi:hypothetical protein